MANFPEELHYTKDHEWLRLDGEQGTVGVTFFAQESLGDVVYVELPDVGAVVTQGQAFGTIESVKAVSELYAPISGEVIDVNAALKQKPEGVNTDPHGSWMIVIKVSNSGELSGLLDAAQYQDLVK